MRRCTKIDKYEVWDYELDDRAGGLLHNLVKHSSHSGRLKESTNPMNLQSCITHCLYNIISYKKSRKKIRLKQKYMSPPWFICAKVVTPVC